MTDEFPLYVEYGHPPKASTLEQDVNDRLTGQQTTAHDVMYGRTDTSAAPDIESVPDTAAVYIVHEDGDVELGAVAVEGEGLIYTHDDFDVEAYKEEKKDD